MSLKRLFTRSPNAIPERPSGRVLLWLWSCLRKTLLSITLYHSVVTVACFSSLFIHLYFFFPSVMESLSQEERNLHILVDVVGYLLLWVALLALPYVARKLLKGLGVAWRWYVMKVRGVDGRVHAAVAVFLLCASLIGIIIFFELQWSMEEEKPVSAAYTNLLNLPECQHVPDWELIGHSNRITLYLTGQCEKPTTH